jgi:hypothetical protein
LTISASGDLSVTFDAAGVFNANYRTVEIGLRSATGGGAAAMTGMVQWASNVLVIRRKYSSIGADGDGPDTFADQASTTLTDGDEPRRLFLHLQRVSNNWSLWYSIDAISWDRIGTTSSDSFTVAHIWLRAGGLSAFGGSAPDVPYYLSNNWIRLNRFFLG